MIHTVVKFDNKLPILDENHKKVGEAQGYAFKDEKNNCIMIVYGEGRKNAMSNYFNTPGDKLELKYHYLNI